MRPFQEKDGLDTRLFILQKISKFLPKTIYIVYTI